MREAIAATLLLMLGVVPARAGAQTPPPTAAPAQASPALQSAAERLLPVIQGAPAGPELFADIMLQAASPEKWKEIFSGVVSQYGRPLALADLRVESAAQGVASYAFERATVRVRLTVGSSGKLIGLFFVGADPRDDSSAKIDADFAALPGLSGYAVARIDGPAPRLIASRNPDRPLPIGSALKLYILDTLLSDIAAGRRRWADVVPLEHRSLPSGIMQSWPQGSPVTLATLTTLMISISDNSAADQLLFTLGREHVEQRLRAIGNSASARTLPFLSTAEAFALKAPASAALRARYLAGSATERRAILSQNAATLSAARADLASLAEGPQEVETVEWFASPADMVKLLTAVQRDADPLARAILAINPGGGGAGDNARWAWLGFKGGSEPGVIHLNYIACAKSGACYAVTGGWTNPKAPVEEARFLGLMQRLLARAAAGEGA